MLRARRGRGGTALGSAVAAAVFAGVLGVLLQLRYGYMAGTADHLVLSLQGLQWGRKDFLVNDWFIRSAPQPHVLFDLVTWLGAATGSLSAVYLAWWFLGLVVGGVATAILARAWTPRWQVAASAAVAALMALGPLVVLGTTTPALAIALPHQLGGFLGYLTGALLLTSRPRAAAVACVLTAAVHVQIGALVVVVCLLAVAAVRVADGRWWWWTLGGAGVAGSVVVTILRLRPVAADPGDFVQICHEVIPFHCDVPTWSAGQLFSGFSVVLAALLTVVLAVRRAGPAAAGPAAAGPATAGPATAGTPSPQRPPVLLWAAVIGAPALGLTLGVIANGFAVPVLGRLAQSTNVFRLAVLVLPFGAWGLLCGALRITRVRRLLWLPPALAAGWGWFFPRGGETALAGHARETTAVLAVAALAMLLASCPGRLLPRLAPVGLAAAGVTLLAAGAVAGTLHQRALRLAFVGYPGQRAIGALIARHVPPGEVVEAPPTWSVIRLTSGRSLLADCKAVPYGGAAWRDYRARLEALGGRGACSHGGAPYSDLPATALVSAAERYGARYLVLGGNDRRAEPVRDLGWRVLATPDARQGSIWIFAAPGAPDGAAAG